MVLVKLSYLFFLNMHTYAGIMYPWPCQLTVSASLIITYHSHPSSERGYTQGGAQAHTPVPTASVTRSTRCTSFCGGTGAVDDFRVCAWMWRSVCVGGAHCGRTSVWSKPTGLSSQEVTCIHRRNLQAMKILGEIFIAWWIEWIINGIPHSNNHFSQGKMEGSPTLSINRIDLHGLVVTFDEIYQCWVTYLARTS